MRKAEEADGKYYYVGHVAAFDNPTLTTKPNAVRRRYGEGHALHTETCAVRWILSCTGTLSGERLRR